MNNLKNALRLFLKKGNGNIIKILSLGTGLAIGLVLISKVCFEISYNDFYPNKDRIYYIKTLYSIQGESKEFSQVSGAVAQGFKDYVPGIEEATMVTPIFESEVFYTPNNEKYSGKFILVDTNFFKIFYRPILTGDAIGTLSNPLQAMVSRSFAEKMGGISEVIGKSLYNEDIPSISFTIGGVFEDFPENSTFRYDILGSMVSYSERSRTNWVGNDRYRAFVRISPNTDPSSLSDAIRKMQVENQPLNEIEKYGNKLTYFLSPLRTLHQDDPAVKEMNILLSIIAFVLILISTMNYILISISSVLKRIKEVGVRKCYGASRGEIRKIIATETLLHLIISLILSVLLVFTFKGTIEELINTSILSLLSLQTIITLLIVVFLVFIISSLIPSYFFQKVPVATVFRSYKESKRKWKLSLLFVQFTATALLTSTLFVIDMQYNKMANDKPGYEYENIIFTKISGISSSKVSKVMSILNGESNVDIVETSYGIPLYYCSGNMVTLPDSDKELFNIADLYTSGKEYFRMMEFEFIEGVSPIAENEVIVSQSFVEKMNSFGYWNDGAVGKNVIISEHEGICTVSGVYKDFRIGPIYNQDNRPSVMFYGTLDNSNAHYLMIKLKKMDSNSIKDIANIIQNSLQNRDVEVVSYKDEIRNLYSESKKFRNTVFIGGIVTLLIAILGVIGYTNDETNRRRSEIAIRKINGATKWEIINLFTTSILYIAIPSIAIGSIASYFVSNIWLRQFADKVQLSPFIFIISSMIVLAIIISVLIVKCIKISNSNPIESIKNE